MRAVPRIGAPRPGPRDVPRATCRARAGFTLLELVVVLFLAALLVSLVAPSLEGPLASARLRAGASELRALLARARSLAAAQARERAVAIDPAAGEFRIAGENRVRRLPEGVRFESVRIAEEETAGPAAIRFFPDGGGDGAEISLRSEAGGRLRVTVEPLTGLAEAGA